MKRLLSLVVFTLGLGACGNPYALFLNSVNLDAVQQTGVIQFTDPKLYKREALINERKNERSYLIGLLEASEKPEFEFKPEIVRELEVIQAFSATAGLKFDPAAAANFQRDTEVAELKQQIELTRLEMQIAQLRRDAELQKIQLSQQTQPSGPAGQPGQGGAGPVTSNIQPPDPQALIAEIEKLRTKLETRLAAIVPPPKKSSGVAGPIDKFNDLAAYRSVLKSAINAVSLDELHDKDGNSLFRVQLRSTVLPGSKDHLNPLGILRMEIGAPDLDSTTVRELYLEWLLHVNRSLNSVPEPGLALGDRRMRTSPGLTTLGDGGELYIVTLLELPKLGFKDDEASEKCGGVRTTERSPGDCWYVRVAAPVLGHDGLSFADALDQTTQFPGRNSGLLMGARRSLVSKSDFEQKPVASQAFTLDGNCTRFTPLTGGPPKLARDDRPGEAGLAPDQALVLSRSVHGWWPYVSAVVGFLSEIDFGENDSERMIALQLTRSLDRVRQVRDAAGAFLVAVAAENPACTGKLLTAASVTVPPTFETLITGFVPRATVYDVAPTERVQRISTVARAADAVALAAAVAGQLPTYGLGLSGNFAYSRTATGKADAIERAPLVVGFAEPGQIGNGKPQYPAFGWLLGPQVSVDPEKQALVLTQRIKPYDLYADLSLPGWWPYFRLTAYTAWAPDWQTTENGATAKVTPQALKRELRVPMDHNTADMDGLTTLLLAKITGQRIAYPSISSIEPRKLSACAEDIQFQIRGENIWRASLVHVGGLAIRDADIDVLPDMRGILAKINVRDIPKIVFGSNIVTVWTKDGPAAFPITFEDKRNANGSCETVKAPPPAPMGPVISSVAPAAISVCDTSAIFTVQGKNLQGATSAVLGTMAADQPTDLPPQDGTAVEVKVSNIDGARKIGKTLAALSLAVRTPRGVATTEIQIAHSDCP